METRAFKDITLSRLGMGNMRLPTVENEPNAPIDRVRAQQIIDYAMSSGVNYYDTAYVYHNGESESFLGEALSKYPRDSFYVATKFFIQANPDYKKVFEEQLQRLGMDHIDFYLIHGIFDNTWESYIESGAVDYFAGLKEEGKIRYLGFSAHTAPENLEKFADHRAWDFAQIQLNYYDWVFGSSKAEYEILQKRNIPVMVMEPVRGGKLATLPPNAEKLLVDAHPDWTIASWALRFVRALPQVQVVLSGMSSLEQIKDNVATFSDDVTFTKEDEAIVLEAAKSIHEELKVPCTGCRYCCDGCPSEINIPAFLDLYNEMKLVNDWNIGDRIATVESTGKPSSCIECGACTSHCPQSINVPAFMKELAAKENPAS